MVTPAQRLDSVPTSPHMAAQGVHGVGSGTYSDAEYQRVVDAFRRAEWPVTVADLHAASGVPGRTVRQIMSDADGVEFVLGGTGSDGYRPAADPADARRLSQRFSSQVVKMMDRLARRDALARTLWGGS